MLKYNSYPLPGSAKVHPEAVTAQSQHIQKVHGNTKVTFSVFAPTQDQANTFYIRQQLQRIASGDLFSGRITDKKEWTRRFGATDAAMRDLATLLRGCNFEILESHPHSGEHLCRAYIRDVKRLITNLDLDLVDIKGVKYRRRTGTHEIAAPKGLIKRILGLDTTPLAHHCYKLPTNKTTTGDASTVHSSPLGSAGAFTPFELMPIFNVPNNIGAGQTIGIIALDGGFNAQDAIDYARKVLKFTGDIAVKVKKIDGATGTPQPDGADIETVLDVDGSLGAPGATIWVCISVNTDAGFAHGIATLIDLGCDIITISWGAAESSWTEQGRDAMHLEFARAFAAGVTVYAAAGDNDAQDSLTDGKVHADYPSSDPLVISMIGLWLSKDGKTFHIWNSADSGTGGGVSDVYTQQDWERVGPQVQSLNDGAVRHWVGGLAGPADPATGLLISYRESVSQVGGTSDLGPIHAGMTARTNAALGKRLGFILPYIIANYATDSQLVVPVTQGDNALAGGKGYTANELTVGMLNFGRLLERLQE